MQFSRFLTEAIPSKKDSRQSGQTLILFAFLVPLLFLFAGAIIDLGWYYLNVSRLQNVADAAVLAGAKSLLEDLKNNNSKYKRYKVTLAYQHPDDSNLYTISSLTKSSTKSLSDITSETKSNADEIAFEYARKNLSSGNVSSFLPSFFSVAEAGETDEANSLEDGWARKNKYSEVKMESPKIYKDGDDFYYVVHLTEDIQHLFLPGGFDPMAAPVVAVAKISKASSSSSGNPKVTFDPNGGKFVNPDDDTTTELSLSIGDITKAINEDGSIAVIVPDGYSSTPERTEYEFLRYWTNEDGLIVPYGTVLTEDNVEEFFKKYDPNAKDNDDYDWENGEIILYAQWVKVKQKPVILVFDPNGGSFSDGTTTPDNSKQIKNPKELEDDETTDPITPNKGKPIRDGYEFYGWSTDKNADANSLVANYISDGKQMTKTELTALFDNKTSVTLYAVWKKINPTVPEEEVKPHNNKTLWEQMQYLIAKNVYDPDWDVSTKKYGFSKLNHNSFDTIDKTYVKDYHYYTEYINLAPKDANGTNLSTVNQYFIDFRRNDWLSVNRKWYYDDRNSRTHALFNVNTTYAVRSGYNDDPMYLRIEAEPDVDHYSNVYYHTPVRQFVININADNTADNKRPLFFYYDGPDKVKSENAPPQPLILNLNANFKGVLWMPDVPVVINGNGHTFEGFIVASEFRYLSTSGTQVKYSSNGQTITNASDNKIRVNTSNGNVNSVLATGADALATYNSYATKFNLSSNSKFRTFKVDTDVKFMYVFYDNNKTLDETPFHEYADLTKDLIPLYKLDAAGNQIRVTNWADVKLYDSDDFATRNEIPKQLTDNNSIRTVRLDSDGNPAPLYDEAGNPVHFCEDYFKLTGTYTVFTLDKVADGTRNEKEFLLTKTDELNVPNTDDWK
ncbi:MAG: Tad domain-containing protein [Quinella sp. 3Q1]|nr:Tad domain-containing protein [Quinella sp. 3Q1]